MNTLVSEFKKFKYNKQISGKILQFPKLSQKEAENLKSYIFIK